MYVSICIHISEHYISRTRAREQDVGCLDIAVDRLALRVQVVETGEHAAHDPANHGLGQWLVVAPHHVQPEQNDKRNPIR